MSRKKGFKVKRSRRNLYKKRKSTGRKIFDGVLFVVILGAFVFVGYSVASPLIKFFGGNGDNSSVSEPAWTPPESLPETSDSNSQANTSDNTSDNSGGSDTTKDNTSSAPNEVTSAFATVAPDSALKSDAALNKFLAEAKDSGYNAAVFTLKNTTGELLYKSSLKAIKDNTDVNKGSLTAAQIVKACKTAGITPVAAITTLYDRKTPYLFDNAGYIISDKTGLSGRTGAEPLSRRSEKISEEVKFTDFTNTNVYATINYSHKQKHRDEESTCTTVITENSRRLRGK